MTNGSVHKLNNYFEAPIAQSIDINLTWGTSLVKKQEARSIKKQERGRERRYSCFSRFGETWGARQLHIKAWALWCKKSMCNSIIRKSMAYLSIFFFKKKQASLLLRDPGTKTVISRAPVVKIAQPKTQIESNDKLYASRVSFICFFYFYTIL